MSTRITANRPEVSSTFRVAGFTVRTGLSPSWFEVALATDPDLFQPEAKARRTQSNFYSSRATGALPATHGDAVYLVPPAILARFAGQPRLYYTVATYRQPDFRNPEVMRLSAAALPSIQISKSFTGNLRGLTGVPNPSGSLTGNGNGYMNGNLAALEWGGDMAAPGEIVNVAMPTNGAKFNGANGANGTNAATPPVATQAGFATAYDDGFGPLPTEPAPSDDEGYGIEGPIPDDAAYSQSQGYSSAFSAPEYTQASRFVAAAASNYRTSSAARTINRIVIHITDGGASINGPISWFQNPAAQVSAHYIVGQDGEVVQMVQHNDVAWHARSANGDSIGIEHVANTRGLNPTETQYCNSAALVRWLADQYNIPLDRKHILGHSEADPATSHAGCPNRVWNWDYFMGMVTSATCYPMPAATTQALHSRSARALSSDIPLDPGNGGQSIGMDALAVGDIIVSTTNQIPSHLIRFGSGAPVSHSMLYTGDGGQVVEAIGDGVVFRPLAEAIADATVAVAFRNPNLTQEQAWQIRDFVGQQIGRAYNYVGVVRQALFQIDRAACAIFSGERYDRCVNFVGRVNLGTASNDTFFCSELVLAAYQAAGVPLTQTPPHWGSPGDLAELSLSGMLGYVGHLKAPPMPTSQAFMAANNGRNGMLSPRQPYKNGAPVAGQQRARAFAGESFNLNWNDVYVVAQPTNMSCWATAAAMLVGWREQMSLSPTYLAQLAGRTDANGLLPADTPAVAAAWGLALEPPQSYSIDGFRQMLEAVGPLWVGAITPLGRHAIVVTGMESDGNPDGSDSYVRVLDPWDREPGTHGHPGAYQNTHNQGSAYTLTWNEFVREYQAGITSSNGVVNIQIIHAGGTGGRRIGLGAQTQSLGRQVSTARQATPLRTARSMAVVEIVSSIAGATMQRILENSGDISWELDQLQGLKHPSDNPANAGSAPYKTTTIIVEGPRFSSFRPVDQLPESGLDLIFADNEITFQHNGRSLGNVQILNLRANDALSLGLSVKAQIMPEADLRPRLPDQVQGAAIKVNFSYIFTQPWPQDDWFGHTQLMLFADGTHDRKFRWTQRG